MGANMEQMFHNLNLRTVTLQGESYLKKRKKKKNVEWLLRDFVFRVHISHSSSPGGSILSTQISVLFNVKEGSTDVHCCSVTSVTYVYVNLYFYNMQMHLNLYRRTPLALVNTGCNILRENCAKMGLTSSFSVRLFVLLPVTL